MQESSKAMAAIAIGAAGFVALAACSSGSDQAEGGRTAAPASSTPGSPTPSNWTAPRTDVALSTKGNPRFKDVTVTTAGSATCKADDSTNELVLNCRTVGRNLVGDQVYIKLPSSDFRVHVKKSAKTKPTMETTARNMFYVKKDVSQANDVTWDNPTPEDFEVWGVGVEGKTGFVDVVVTVTKTD